MKFDIQKESKITYRTHLGGDEITQPVKPLNVRFEITSLFHVLKRSFHIRVLFSKSLDELLGSDE